MKICYVVTSSTWDIYSQMFYISASAVKRLYPKAHVVLVTDPPGAAFAKREDYPLARLLDEVIEVPCEPTTDSMIRSRFLKTNLRNLLQGEFLFLDADTLPIRPFEQIFEAQGDMAAADDRNRDCPKPHIPTSFIEPLYRQVGWSVDLKNYYNTGVIFFRDSPQCHDLCGEWHKRWLLSCGNGVYYDQPAFNSAVNEIGADISLLHPSFNAMVDADPKLAHGAKILHFYSQARYFDNMILSFLLKGIKAPLWSIDWNAVDKCVKANHPWGPPTLPPLLWLSGNYTDALFAVPRHPMTVARPFARRVFHAAKKIIKRALRA